MIRLAVAWQEHRLVYLISEVSPPDECWVLKEMFILRQVDWRLDYILDNWQPRLVLRSAGVSNL